MKRLTDTACVFRIHLARLRAEAGPFILAALLFPSAMYLFANAVGGALVLRLDQKSWARIGV